MRPESVESYSPTVEDAREKVKAVRYRYDLSSEEAEKLESSLIQASSLNEFVDVLESKLMEFTLRKGKPSRREFEEVNTEAFAGFSA
ncbi:MAG: hypothetical protein R6V35_02110 [Candidatus Nanohaloarchaea archaeon]